MMFQKKRYGSLAELRADKQVVSREVDKRVNRLRKDVIDSFVPSSSLLDAGIPYLKYVGYAVTAFKTAKAVKSLFDFMGRRG